MFLDDELYQIGSKINPDYSNDLAIIKEMVWCCINRSEIDLKNIPDDSYLYATFKRINMAWNNAVVKLNKSNKKFVKFDGFILFLLHDNGFEALHPILRKII